MPHTTLERSQIHFHLIGNVKQSIVKGCSVHHAFNRAIAIHGVNHLRVTDNVIYDSRGHSVFLEDGTEMYNVIERNLNIVVRPVWSLLTVDESPACFWIVNPNNIVRDNICAGSSHYGFWYRALKHPDGVSGAEAKDASKATNMGGNPLSLGVAPLKSDGLVKCPNMAPLGAFEGNIAHSTGKFGLKLSSYYPTKQGFDCGDKKGRRINTIPRPAVFRDFLGFKNQFFGVWGEVLVDVHFDRLRVLDHGFAGMEFMYIGGKGSFFTHSVISNSLFVGYTNTNDYQGSFGNMAEAY